MKDLIKRLKPDCFDEVIALVALFRPGPLQSGMVDDFIDRKHGAAVNYFHPSLEPILSPTYGVILYQEQVMQIAQVLSGYSLGEADMLRRAMGKKKPEEMAKQRDFFQNGAEKLGVDGKLATRIFDLMEKFAGYGFNKSHSAAYALIAYQTAWLKAHFPSAFMAAVLSADMDNTEKVVMLVEECHTMKLKVDIPDINTCRCEFTVNGSDTVIYGLGAIKGVGEAALEGIVEERDNNGPYKDIFDLCKRVDLRKVNKRVLEALIRAGAFDSFSMHRALLMAAIPAATQMAERFLKDSEAGQNSLFGDVVETVEADDDIQLPDVAEWSDEIRLQGEKETLGLYITGHPIERYETELKQFVRYTVAEANRLNDQSLLIAGMVTGIRIMYTKRGDRLAFITLEDRTGRIDVTLYGETFNLYQDLIGKDKIIIIQGNITTDDYTGKTKLVADHVYDIGQARQRYLKYLAIGIDGKNSESVYQLANILKPYRHGKCPIRIDYAGKGAAASLACGQDWRVYPSDELLNQLENLSSAQHFEMIY